MGTCPRHYATMMLIDKNIYTINCVEYCLLVGTIRSANSGESITQLTLTLLTDVYKATGVRVQVQRSTYLLVLHLLSIVYYYVLVCGH